MAKLYFSDGVIGLIHHNVDDLEDKLTNRLLEVNEPKTIEEVESHAANSTIRYEFQIYNIDNNYRDRTLIQAIRKGLIFATPSCIKLTSEQSCDRSSCE